MNKPISPMRILKLASMDVNITANTGASEYEFQAQNVQSLDTVLKWVRKQIKKNDYFGITSLVMTIVQKD